MGRPRRLAYARITVTISANIILGVFLAIAGGAWLVSPHLWASRLPDDQDELWSLPRLNAMAWIPRFVRWASQTRAREVVVGIVGLVWGVGNIWLAFHLG